MTKQEFLAMNLPYGLKCMWFDGKISEVSMYAIPTAILENSKFILHPLSDLTKPIEHKGERFIPMVKLLQVAYDEVVQGEDCLFSYGEDMYTLMINDIRWVFDVTNSSFYTFMDGLPMVVTNQMTLFSKLFEWHFDIADLISKGEAIDVNTLETNPYK